MTKIGLLEAELQDKKSSHLTRNNKLDTWRDSLSVLKKSLSEARTGNKRIRDKIYQCRRKNKLNRRIIREIEDQLFYYSEQFTGCEISWNRR